MYLRHRRTRPAASQCQIHGRHWVASLTVGLLAGGWVLGGCSSSNPPAQPERPLPRNTATDDSGGPSPPPRGPLEFVDVAASIGLQFHHYSPLTSKRHIHLFLGSGIGWFDFDRDGWPDLFCCQGTDFGSPQAAAGDRPENGHADRGADTSGKGTSGSATPSNVTNTLFQNRLGNALDDVTHLAGLANVDYSMAVSAADYNNDGFSDLVVTGYHRNTLYRNNGDGTFSPVPLPQAERLGRLSASCVWGDFDDDGNLDLFITNYARLGPTDYPTCEHTAAGKTIPISCHPALLEALHDTLYRNTGQGDFVEASREAGLLLGPPRAGLGVVAADLDQDGDIDLYVANDTTENHLWENQGQGRFLDRGAASGTSRNRHGENEAGMGIVAGDLMGRGRIDLFVTNYYGETNTLYRNDTQLFFADVTEETGLGAPSRLRLGFGTSLADFDNDGWLDLLIANGHVQDRLPDVDRNEPFAQLPLVFQNQHGVRFHNVSDGAGEYFRTPRVGRSTAISDFDRDGDPDVAINCHHDAAALLRTEAGQAGNWLRIALVGRESNRDGIGALVRVEVGELTLLRSIQAGTGYLSCDESTILVGLGQHDGPCGVTVTWPGGQRETWTSLAVNRPWRLIQGSGQKQNVPP